jgi:signal-transduction protein with cAMP-binding, CBS, and nucleotidyltransferase domain
MPSAYIPRDCIPLQASLPIEHPEEPPELVHFHDSAMLVFTDFARVYPVTITTDRSIEYALKKMKNAGVRLLIAVDKKKRMIGLISADQILGDEPIRLAEDKQLDHSQITVGMLMQPQSEIRVLELSHLRDAMVGHIVATLHQLEQKHMIVIDQGVVCGLFSASQISRQLGRNFLKEENPAHSLAEMVHAIG